MSAGEEVDYPDHSEALASLVGLPTGPPLLAHSAVNQAMIHHWVEAMGDEDPIYLSDEAARAVGLERAIAPPTMLDRKSTRLNSSHRLTSRMPSSA